MGIEVVKAIQFHGVIAMAKHFVLNDQVNERFPVNVEIAEDVLRELYLLLPAYSHLLLNVLRGGSTLSIRTDEPELAWRIVTPILEAWADDRVALQDYAAGSTGPP